MQLTLSSGDAAQLVHIDGERAELRMPIAAAPGSRVTAQLADGAALELKVRGCKKRDDGTFSVRGRLVDLTRVLRERLTSELQR